jgi:hypothetical protein
MSGAASVDWATASRLVAAWNGPGPLWAVTAQLAQETR